jgi:mono/diheme cytochrome c family protein
MATKLFVSLIAITVILVISGAAFAADPVAGRTLAEKWCAKCHNIEKGAPFKLHPPSFASIAIYRPPDDIRGKIVAPHPYIPMPELMDWMRRAEDIDNLVAYITSLETK